jgi:hypothetical protein
MLWGQISLVILSFFRGLVHALDLLCFILMDCMSQECYTQPTEWEREREEEEGGLEREG